MGRSSYAESQSVGRGVNGVPYSDHKEIANTLRHAAEVFVGNVTGAGGVGGVLSGIPFEPAIIDLYEPAGPVMQRDLPGAGGTRVKVNLITGAAAATAFVIATDGPGFWKVTFAVGHIANAAVATIVCTGFRSVGGSL